MWLAESVRELLRCVTSVDLTIKASINNSRARAEQSVKYSHGCING